MQKVILEKSQPGTRQALTFICTFERLIPRSISHVSEEEVWCMSSMASDLIHCRSTIQYGLDALVEVAMSRVPRLRTSSQEDRRRFCRSSMSEWWGICTINDSKVLQRYQSSLLSFTCDMRSKTKEIEVD